MELNPKPVLEKLSRVNRAIEDGGGVLSAGIEINGDIRN